MRNTALVTCVLVCAMCGFARGADDLSAVRVRFGMKAQDNMDFSGTITPAAGKVESIRGWRWMPGDHASGNAFTVMVRRQQAQSSADRKRVREGGTMPMQDNGIVAALSGVGVNDVITFDSKGGKFEFKLSDVPYGKRLIALEGDAEVTRVPASAELAASQDDEDYPSIAVAKDGTIYLAYVSFTHGTDFQGPRERPTTPESGPVTGPLAQGEVKRLEKPEDFDYLAQPVGGERVMLRVCKAGVWGEAVQVSEAGQEVYRPAVAIDGSGTVWVFYPAHVGADSTYDHGNWELLARAFDAAGKNPAGAINISNAEGTDMQPAAATDSDGKITVAWVGAREKCFNVFHASQAGDGFSIAARLTDATANEWEPAVAADAAGHLSIAYDTYAKGDYDVYLAQRGTDGKFGKPMPVAATLGFEVRPSIAYDKDGKLWIAWEVSGDQWGKDFGALKKKGIPLYNGGRSIAVKAMSADGQWMQPPDVMEAMPTGGRASPQAQRTGMNSPIAPTFPRLAIDPAGEVYLAFRGRPGGNWRVAVGSVWCEYVTRLNGDRWTTGAWVPRSNNILDNRPAVAASADGLLMVYSGDGRGELNPPRTGDPHLRGAADGDGEIELAAAAVADAQANSDDAPPATGDATTQRARRGGGGGGRRAAAAGMEINADLFMTLVRAADFDPAGGDVALAKVEPPAPDAPSPDTESEMKAIAAIRDYRANLNGESLRIWRGEFHRHTELSPDGGGDGGLLDMWRYGIDAAGLDWIGDGDHDYGNGREYSWWTTQKAVTLFTVPRQFTPVFSYERSVSYPEGHRNCMFAQRGVRSLPRLPISDPERFAPAPDTNMLYVYLKRFNGLCSPHTSATDMGTDWRNYDAEVEPFVEIYQGDRNNYERPDSPRSAVTEARLKQSTPERESLGGWRPKGFVNLALLKGTRYAFQASSDHISTHLSYCNVYLAEPTRENILAAVRKKRVYGATDNIIADVRCKTGGVEHFMGEEFETSEAPTLDVRFIGAQKIAKVTIIKDDVEVHVAEPNEIDVKFSWTDPSPTAGKTSYYYVRAEQVPDMEGVSSGEIAWASPMWITVKK